MSHPRIVLVRHGETRWSLEGRYTGRNDIPLTAAGREEAAGLGPALGSWTFSRVLSSPLRRARDSCLLTGLGPRMEIRPDLIEWDYGTYEGRTPEQITAERSDWSLWHQGPPGGETLDAVQRRLDRVVADLRTSTGDIAVFAHRDVLRVLAARWIGVAALTGRHLVLATGTISVLGWERDTPCILSWNQPAHRS